MMKCALCHGPALSGTVKGPPLHDLARHWDAAGLAAFLAAPDSFVARDARLQDLAQHFAPSSMPGYPIAAQPLHELAGYLIEATK
jgi:hypothetical protein